MDSKIVITMRCRAGETMAAARARYEATLANPSIVIVELGPNGHCRVEKPVTAADLVPELPAPEGSPC